MAITYVGDINSHKICQIRLLLQSDANYVDGHYLSYIRVNRLKNTINITLIISLVLWGQPAMAYIDPGSGSAIMSAIIGFFVAVGLAVKTYWYKLKSIFTGKQKSPLKNSESGKEKK